MNKNTKSLIKRRDALLGEISSLSCILNGSLVERYSTCSRKNCACHTGKRHGPRLYLATTGDKGQRQFYIRAEHAERAAQGVAQGRRLRAIVRELTAINLQLLRKSQQEVNHD
jgi:hypothetical protein